MKLCIVAGMPRSGTTFLYHNLQRHPDIFAPFRKEVNYFNVHYGKGEAWYRDMYKEADARQVCLDITPTYFLEPLTDDRINSFGADTKIILAVRDPVDWPLSYYAQFSSFNYNMPSFEDFLKGYEYKIDGQTLLVDARNNFIPRRITQMMEAFGDRLLVYPYRLLEESPLVMFRGIEKFLGISSYFDEGKFDNRKINASGRKNMVWLTRLMANPTFKNLVQKAVPRALILKARQKFDAAGAKKPQSSFEHDPKHKALCEEMFAEQQRWVDALFSEHDFILGDGTPLYADEGLKKRAAAR